MFNDNPLSLDKNYSNSFSQKIFSSEKDRKEILSVHWTNFKLSKDTYKSICFLLQNPLSAALQSLVLMADGNSEHVAHASRKIGLF